MPTITETIKDITGAMCCCHAHSTLFAVSLLFNNAGFITTGLFYECDLNRLQVRLVRVCDRDSACQANFECNAACQIDLTHQFLNQLVAKK
jgi:hypothetical protein